MNLSESSVDSYGNTVDDSSYDSSGSAAQTSKTRSVKSKSKSHKSSVAGQSHHTPRSNASHRSNLDKEPPPPPPPPAPPQPPPPPPPPQPVAPTMQLRKVTYYRVLKRPQGCGLYGYGSSGRNGNNCYQSCYPSRNYALNGCPQDTYVQSAPYYVLEQTRPYNNGVTGNNPQQSQIQGAPLANNYSTEQAQQFQQQQPLALQAPPPEQPRRDSRYPDPALEQQRKYSEDKRRESIARAEARRESERRKSQEKRIRKASEESKGKQEVMKMYLDAIQKEEEENQRKKKEEKEKKKKKEKHKKKKDGPANSIQPSASTMAESVAPKPSEFSVASSGFPKESIMTIDSRPSASVITVDQVHALSPPPTPAPANANNFMHFFDKAQKDGKGPGVITPPPEFAPLPSESILTVTVTESSIAHIDPAKQHRNSITPSIAPSTVSDAKDYHRRQSTPFVEYKKHIDDPKEDPNVQNLLSSKSMVHVLVNVGGKESESLDQGHGKDHGHGHDNDHHGGQNHGHGHDKDHHGGQEHGHGHDNDHHGQDQEHGHDNAHHGQDQGHGHDNDHGQGHHQDGAQSAP